MLSRKSPILPPPPPPTPPPTHTPPTPYLGHWCPREGAHKSGKGTIAGQLLSYSNFTMLVLDYFPPTFQHRDPLPVILVLLILRAEKSHLFLSCLAIGCSALYLTNQVMENNILQNSDLGCFIKMTVSKSGLQPDFWTQK